ncbi:hypothetical protein CRUP_018582, partial [Coryphaenoides rupestris]
MGNEASLEGAEGGLSGGLVLPDGQGGFVRLPGATTEADLSQLSEEDRRRLVAAAAPPEAGAQQRSQQAGAGASRGPTGLSKSRTVDAFGQGPVSRAPPGRSPSSLSLLESRFRQEPKDPTEGPKASGMFGSGFLSGANPLSAMTSSMSGLFGDDDAGDTAGPKQGGKPPAKGPQQGGPPKQGQGQQQGPKQGPPGPQQGGPPKQGQGPKQGAIQQQKSGPPSQGPGKSGPKPQGPQGPGAKPGDPTKAGAALGQQGPGKPGGGGLCGLCKTTQLNVGSKEPPNYCNCTECKSQVCNLCGFSPPDSGGKEWLCLNCQMQRAMDGMDGKPGKLLIKQQSTTIDPAPRSPGLGSPGASSPKIDPKTGRPIQQKGSPQPSPSPSPAKAKDKESSFFGGFSLGGLTEADQVPRPSPRPSRQSLEAARPAKQQEESVAGKLFGGFGGLTESSSSSTAAKLPTTSRSQMFGFG